MKAITTRMANAIQKILDVPGVDKGDLEDLVMVCCERGYEQAKQDWEEYNKVACERYSGIIH